MIIAYKAFDKDLSCTSGGNRFQYQSHIWNEEPEANCRKNGFHCAENPLDCFTYYPCWTEAVYYMVLADGDINEDGHDSKISCTRMKLIKPLTLEEWIAHSLKYVVLHPYRANAHRIQKNQGTASGGFTVVRGKNPLAKGKMGDVLGLLKEERDSIEIAGAGLYVVDGKTILPDVWYDMEGNATRS